MALATLALVVVNASAPEGAVAALRFSATVRPANRAVTAGDPTAYELSLVGSRLPAAVDLTSPGLPAGVSVQFLSTASKLRRIVLVRTAPSTPSGTHEIVIEASAGGVTRRTSVTLSVSGTVAPPTTTPTTAPVTTKVVPAPTTVPTPTTTAPPATTAPPTIAATTTTVAARVPLRASPAIGTVTAGQKVSYNVIPDPLGQTINYITSGVPSGTTVDITPNPSFGQTTLTFATTTATPAGVYPITVIGVGPTSAESVVLTLDVRSPGAFTVSPSPQSVVAGAAATYAISIATGNSFTSISFGIQGLPPGTAAVFAPVSGSNAATLIITTANSTPLATHALTVTGTAGGATITVPIQLVVTAPPGNLGFGLAVTPSAASVARGSAFTFNVTITPQPGFSGPIAVTVTGLAAGATALFVPDNTPGAVTITGRLTISTASTTPLATQPFLVNASGAGLSATVTVVLTTT